MYTAPFEYHTPTSLDDAIGLLDNFADDAKLLAGGHSLIPVMKLRFAQPRHLVDLRRVPDLTGIREDGGALVIGAMTTYATVHYSNLVRGKLPILAEAVGLVGDPLVRNRGTVGGSLAHADPGGDLPAVAIGLHAEITVRGKGGSRTIKADDFFVDLLTTSLRPGEVLTEIRFPIPAGTSGEAYEKHKHPASSYALCGVAAVVTLGDGGVIERASVGLTGVGTKAVRADSVERALAGQPATAESCAAAAEHAAEGVDVRDDLQYPRAYRENLARVCTRRALERAVKMAKET